MQQKTPAYAGVFLYPNDGTVGLAVPARELKIGLSAIACSHRPCPPLLYSNGGSVRIVSPVRSCGGHTRMTGRRNLSTLHAELAVGLTEGKGSPAPAESRTRMGECANCQFRTRAENQLISNRMLFCAVRKVRRNELPWGCAHIPTLEWQASGICPCHPRLIEKRGLLFSLVPPKATLSESACSLIIRPLLLYSNGRSVQIVSPARRKPGYLFSVAGRDTCILSSLVGDDFLLPLADGLDKLGQALLIEGGKLAAVAADDKGRIVPKGL